MVECPECGTLFRLGWRQKIGDAIECPECAARLEVVELAPPMVELALDEDDWDDEDAEDDEDELTDVWECAVCGHLYEGQRPPMKCPECGASGDQFDYVEEDIFEDDELFEDDESEDEIVF